MDNVYKYLWPNLWRASYEFSQAMEAYFKNLYRYGTMLGGRGYYGLGYIVFKPLFFP